MRASNSLSVVAAAINANKPAKAARSAMRSLDHDDNPVPATPDPVPSGRRGRPARLPGEANRRIVVYLGADSEFPKLLAAAQLNNQTVSEFMRDAANAAAEECGAPAIFTERRAADRRAQTVRVRHDRRHGDRREEA
jgi:hypothetical protein